MLSHKVGEKVWIATKKLELFRVYYGPTVAGTLEVVALEGDRVAVKVDATGAILVVYARWLMVRPAGWDPESADAAAA